MILSIMSDYQTYFTDTESSKKPFAFQLISDVSKTKKLNQRSSKSSSPQLGELNKKNVEATTNHESGSVDNFQEPKTAGGKDKVDLNEMLEAAQMHIRSRLMDLSGTKPVSSPFLSQKCFYCFCISWSNRLQCLNKNLELISKSLESC